MRSDPLVAIVNTLKRSVDVVALVEDRVWGQEYLRAALDNMPQKAIVVTSAGGRPLGPNARSWGKIGGIRIDVRCYGETPAEAAQVELVVWDVFRAHRADGHSGEVGIYWFRPEGGPIPLRDPDGDHPYVLSSYQVMIGEVANA